MYIQEMTQNHSIAMIYRCITHSELYICNRIPLSFLLLSTSLCIADTQASRAILVTRDAYFFRCSIFLWDNQLLIPMDVDALLRNPIQATALKVV
jgi:hypothetical protein